MATILELGDFAVCDTETYGGVLYVEHTSTFARTSITRADAHLLAQLARDGLQAEYEAAALKHLASVGAMTVARIPRRRATTRKARVQKRAKIAGRAPLTVTLW